MRFQGIPPRKRSETMWEIPQMSGMRVPGLVFASERMMTEIVKGGAIRQVINVAHLPGIQRYSIGMPDIHWGYGFPIGGVAAMDVEEGGVSPGGGGYDINCGSRLARLRPPRGEGRGKGPPGGIPVGGLPGLRHGGGRGVHRERGLFPGRRSRQRFRRREAERTEPARDPGGGEPLSRERRGHRAL